jgi:Calcineurin-like phosphoesterase
MKHALAFVAPLFGPQAAVLASPAPAGRAQYLRPPGCPRERVGSAHLARLEVTVPWSLLIPRPAPARRNTKLLGHEMFSMNMPVLLAGLALLGALGCERTSAPSEANSARWEYQPPKAAPSFASWPNEASLIGAGDIAWCFNNGDEATAKLLDTLQGTVFTAGDNAYSEGTASEYANCYDPTWGRHKARTRPSPGNHDYETSGAAPYYTYFGSHAGPTGRGYYSYTLGSWHVVSLNSNVSMASGSAQYTWLRNDLAASTALCTLAYWHHALFSSGTQVGGSTASKPVWKLLYASGADVVVVGHEHNYERFAPQTPQGVADASYGLREFVVGTGGKTLSSAVQSPRLANSQVFNGTTWGVLALRLGDGGYRWKFVPVAGKSFTDAGSTACHGKPGGGA